MRKKENCSENAIEAIKNYGKWTDPEVRKAIAALAMQNCKKPCQICPLDKKNSEKKILSVESTKENPDQQMFPEWFGQDHVLDLKKLKNFRGNIKEKEYLLLKFNSGFEMLLNDLKVHIYEDKLDFTNNKYLREIFESKFYSILIFLPPFDKRNPKNSKLRDLILSTMIETNHNKIITIKDIREMIISGEESKVRSKMNYDHKKEGDKSLIKQLKDQFANYQNWLEKEKG